MLKKDRSIEAPGRLDNLKELVNAINEFESLQNFLEHIQLVMEGANNQNLELKQGQKVQHGKQTFGIRQGCPSHHISLF